MSAKRKFRRSKKKAAEKEVKQKMNMFDRMPSKCLACFKEFDKTDREQVMSWYVVERRNQKTVNLYCPECWQEGTSLAKQISQEQELKKVNKLDYFINKVRREREDLQKRRDNEQNN